MLKELQVRARCKRAAQVLVAVWALAACGGGGGDDASAPTYALQSAYANWVKNGSNDTYTVSGFCSGSVSIRRSASVPAVFKAINGFSVAESFTFQYTGCSDPALNISGSDSGTTYFDANSVVIGSDTTGEYTEFATTRPMALPASVVVGNQGAIGTLTNYTDSTKTTVDSTSVISYSIEADTPASTDSVVLNLTIKDYDVANRLILTFQDRYRLTRSGVLSSVSMNLVGDALSLTLTRN